MLRTFPSTMLRTDLSTAKEAARHAETIITDKSNTHYVFASEDVFAHTIERAATEAAYAERMARGIRRARAGIEHGEYVVGADAAIAEAERRRTDCG